MNKQLSRLLLSHSWAYFVALALCILAAALLGQYWLAAGEALLTVLLAVLNLLNLRRRRRAILQFIEHAAAQGQTMAGDVRSMPLPMAVLQAGTGDVVWGNSLFIQLTGGREQLYDIHLHEIFPEFDLAWLEEGKSRYPREFLVDGRRYRVYGSLIDNEAGEPAGLAALYWVDQTGLLNTRDEYLASRPVVAILLVDNYEELTNTLSDSAVSAIAAQIDQKVTEWAGQVPCLLRKLERNRYLMLMEERDLPRLREGKFAILETIHEVRSEQGVPATVSLGIGRDGEHLKQCYEFATAGLEMCLSRGGDQAVIRDRTDFTFIGGRTKEGERRTTIKARVMVGSLTELIGRSSSVFLMGHRNADLDALGAAAGMMALCRKTGKRARIVMDPEHNMCQKLLERLHRLPEYEHAFLSPQEAAQLVDSESLVIVVDTNRPSQVESQTLLERAGQLVVIDHHRREADYIEGYALHLHEPYASSASELVTELLQYGVEMRDILPQEAGALLAGISLDTKNFAIRTGSQTFEAAAFLRRAGADPSEIKKLFQNDLPHTVERYAVIQAAKLYRDSLAVAAVDSQLDRVVASQAADELLNISGIETSFVLYPDAPTGRVIICARSIGEVNVQLILAELGGGGNAAVAGGQVEGTLEEVLWRLIEAIDHYFET